MLQRTLIADLAKELGKSEEEVRQFIEALWQRLPLIAEVEPPFVRYLDARIESVKSTLETQIESVKSTLEARIESVKSTLEATINGLSSTIDQRFLRLEERDEALRREMTEKFEALRQEMGKGFRLAEERDEALRREMSEKYESLRQEMIGRIESAKKELMQGINLVRQDLNSLRDEVKRLERRFLAFPIPLLLMLAVVIVQNLLK